MRLALASLTLALAASLAQAKVDLSPKAKKIEDPGSATPLIYKSPTKTHALDQGVKGATKSRVTATCTDDAGLTVKQGDRGYEACLRGVNQARPQPEPSEKNPNSVGITIGR